MSEASTVYKFKIYDGDAEATVELTPEKDYEIVMRLIEWYQKNDAVDGEVIFQSDRCQISACELLAELADDVFKFETEYKDD